MKFPTFHHVYKNLQTTRKFQLSFVLNKEPHFSTLFKRMYNWPFLLKQSSFVVRCNLTKTVTLFKTHKKKIMASYFSGILLEDSTIIRPPLLDGNRT